MTDERQVWELADPGGTPVARVDPEPDANGRVKVTLYPTAHAGQAAHDPVVAAIREKLEELGLDAASIDWIQEQWPMEA